MIPHRSDNSRPSRGPGRFRACWESACRQGAKRDPVPAYKAARSGESGLVALDASSKPLRSLGRRLMRIPEARPGIGRHAYPARGPDGEGTSPARCFVLRTAGTTRTYVYASLSEETRVRRKLSRQLEPESGPSRKTGTPPPTGRNRRRCNTGTLSGRRRTGTRPPIA